ncbi:MAG: carbohydrate ABC transporter permease [Thermomicrobiales bacterium]
MAVITGPEGSALTATPSPSRASRAGANVKGFFAEIWKHRADYLYILPALAVMMVVIAYPIYFTVRLSFYDHGRTLSFDNLTWVGLDNYRLLLTGTYSSEFWKITRNTMVWTVFSTLGAFFLGLGAALVVQREFIGRSVVRGILLVPWVISAVAAAYVWRWLYHSDYGLISGVLTELGLVDNNIIFLDSVEWVMPSLIVANIWKEFPFAMIMLLAGLQTVPEGLNRAAMVDGASTWNRFWHITMPHLKGVTLITVLLLTVQNLNSFTTVFIMTGGGPANASQLWVTDIYRIAFQRTNFDVASAYSVILFSVMAVLGYFYVRALTRGDSTRSAA